MLGVGRHLRHIAPGIGKKLELAAGRHRRIELPERACGSVARIDIGLLAFGCHAGIERQEIFLRHIDLAAHFHLRRRTFRQRVGNLGDGLDVGGDIFAGGAVAAGGGGDQLAVLIADRHRQPVDLRLGGEGD